MRFRALINELVLTPDQLAQIQRRKRWFDQDGQQSGVGTSSLETVPIGTPGAMSGTPSGQRTAVPNIPGRSEQPQQTAAPTPAAGTASATPQYSQTSAVPQASPPQANSPQGNTQQASAQPGQQGASSQPGTIVGSRFTVRGDISHVNPVLLQTLHAASTYLPDGYRAEMTSGYRDPKANAATQGAEHSQHLTGNAVDIHILDPQGNIIPNRNQGVNSPYGIMARAGYHYLQATNPEQAAKFNWGGNFTYHGFADSMHYDFGNRPGGQLPNQYQQFTKTDNFKPWDQSTMVASAAPQTSPGTSPGSSASGSSPGAAALNTSNVPPSNQMASNSGAVPAGNSTWTPSDYPNAPIDSPQTISHPERNNPGNLRFAATNDWQGKQSKPGDAFETFDTMQNGVRARALTYNSYLKRGVNTIDKIANTSGPGSDNNNVPSEITAYRQALGGQYMQPGGEHLPIDMTPENIRRLTAGGISIESGGGGKWLPQGAGMNVIDNVVQGLHQEGHFGSSTPPPTNQNQTTASVAPPPSSPPPQQVASIDPNQSSSGSPQTPPTSTPSSTSSTPTINTLSSVPPTPTPPADASVKTAMTAPVPIDKPTQTESYRRPAMYLLRPL